MSKTPEEMADRKDQGPVVYELADKYIQKAKIVRFDKWMQPFCRDAFIAGWEAALNRLEYKADSLKVTLAHIERLKERI
jgi:hypothetical protein